MTSYKTKIYSIGASDEDHNPALPNNIDDLYSKRLALITSEILGADYRGHLPFSGDKVGNIAKAWNHNYVEMQELISGVEEWIKRDLRLNRGKSFNHIAIISGHGGNNLLEDVISEMSNKIGFPMFYFPPLEDVEFNHHEFGKIVSGHSNACENSIGKYLSKIAHPRFFNQEGFDWMKHMAEKDPVDLLKQWPSIELAGYCLPELDPEKKFKNLQTERRVKRAKDFVKRRKVFANADVGEYFFKGEIDTAVRKIEEFVKNN